MKIQIVTINSFNQNTLASTFWLVLPAVLRLKFPLLSPTKRSSRKLYVGSSWIKLLSTQPVQLFLGNNGSLCQRNKTCLSWFGCRQCALAGSNYCFLGGCFFLSSKPIKPSDLLCITPYTFPWSSVRSVSIWPTGGYFHHNCPVQPYIPIYMEVMGTVTIVTVIAYWWYNDSPKNYLVITILTLGLLFCFCFFITGKFKRLGSRQANLLQMKMQMY